MNYEYRTTHQLAYSELDQYDRMSPQAAISLTQDVMTRYYETFHSDNDYLSRHYGAVWVIAKTRLHVERYPEWADTLSVYSCTTGYSHVHSSVETSFRDEKGALLLAVGQEYCPIDLEKRAIRRLSTIGYPGDMIVREPVLPEDFSRLRRPFCEAEKAAEYVVPYSDIDFSRHTNNVFYVRYLLNSGSSAYWKDKFLYDIEIHYLHECREGARLSIYRAETAPEDGKPGGAVEFLIREGEKEIVRARMLYR